MQKYAKQSSADRMLKLHNPKEIGEQIKQNFPIRRKKLSTILSTADHDCTRIIEKETYTCLCCATRNSEKQFYFLDNLGTLGRSQDNEASTAENSVDDTVSHSEICSDYKAKLITVI